MAQQIERSEPPYVQIADYYRELISSGALSEGERLPSVRQIAQDWNVVRATANRSVKYLAAAQLVDITQAGTVVRKRRVTPAPQDRVRLAIDGTSFDSETIDVREAGLVQKAYVARILGVDDDAEVIRREQVTYRDGEPTMLAVHWTHGDFAAAAPELTSTDPISAVATIERTTGRTVTRGTDSVTSRTADKREAAALHVGVGTPVLAVVWTWGDDQGILEYGEYVCPPEHVITYHYPVSRQEST